MKEFVMFSSLAFFFNLPILNIALGLVLEMTPSSCQTWPTPSGWGQQKYTDPPIPSGNGTAPVRKTTTWLTLSASWISATTLVGPACSHDVDTSLPETISPNIAILAQLPSTESSRKLSSTLES